MKERIFIRCQNSENGKIYVDEVEAELAFEINGFRFMYHHGRITGALCGLAIGKPRSSHRRIAFLESKEEFIARIEKSVRLQFDKYLNFVKGRKRASYRTKL